GTTPLRPSPGPALLKASDAHASEPTQQFRIAPDKDTLVAPPTPPKGVTPVPRPPPDSHELPTMKMDEGALVQAEKEFAARQAMGVSVAFGEDDPTDVDPPEKTAVLPPPPQHPPPPPAD